MVYLYRRFPQLAEGDIVSTTAGVMGIDLQFSPLAKKTIGLSIEAKNTKAQPGKAALEQARYNAYKGTFPVVVWHPARTSQDAEESGVALIMLKDLLEYGQMMHEQGRTQAAAKKEPSL